MNFTKDDILKIKQALDKYGVKDTEFQYADTPISTKDIVTVVQDGQNKKIYVKEFVNELMDVFGEAFINLTDRYGVYIDSLKDAISQIPSRQRKKGLLITFYDKNKKWKLYQFQGEINQFNNPNLWVDLFNVESYAINSLLADEEDLTATERDNNGNSKIKLKDRRYDPSTFSGMGHKILRKNIVRRVNDDGTIDYINYLSANEFSDSNTIYEIRYDFDLRGKDIQLLDNCVLLFKGGSIDNGTITCNNTYILQANESFRSNLTVKGIIKNSAIDSEWWYIPANDCYYQIKDIINIANLSEKPVRFKKGKYLLLNHSEDSIIIQQSVDFGDATFILNTNGYENFNFNILQQYSQEIDSDDFTQIQLALETKNLNADVFRKYKNCLLSVDSNEVELIRSNGEAHKKHEILYVDINGYLQNTPFNESINITKGTYIKCNKQQYIRNLNLVIEDTYDKTQVSYYRRLGFKINNCSNLTIENIIIEDPNITKYRIEIFGGGIAYNLIFKNCHLTNTKDNKDYIIGDISAYVFDLRDIVQLRFDNVQVSNLTSFNVWGATGTNYIVDWVIENSSLNRVDTHYRLNNLYINNSVIGVQPISYTGFGKIVLTNTKFFSNVILQPRVDYGSFFDGDVIIENCEVLNHKGDGSIYVLVANIQNGNHSTANPSHYKYLGARNVYVRNLKCNYPENNQFKVFHTTRFELSGNVTQFSKRIHPNIYIDGVNDVKLRLYLWKYQAQVFEKTDVLFKISNCIFIKQAYNLGLTEFLQFTNVETELPLYKEQKDSCYNLFIDMKNCRNVVVALYSNNATFNINDSTIMYQASQSGQGSYTLDSFDNTINVFNSTIIADPYVYVPYKIVSQGYYNNCTFSSVEIEDTTLIEQIKTKMRVSQYTNGKYYYDSSNVRFYSCRIDKKLADYLEIPEDSTFYDVLNVKEVYIEKSTPAPVEQDNNPLKMKYHSAVEGQTDEIDIAECIKEGYYRFRLNVLNGDINLKLTDEIKSDTVLDIWVLGSYDRQSSVKFVDSNNETINVQTIGENLAILPQWNEYKIFINKNEEGFQLAPSYRPFAVPSANSNFQPLSGYNMIQPTLGAPIWYDGQKWIYANGQSADYRIIGSIDNRPTLTEATNVNGFQYYNTTSKSPCWWDGERWITFDIKNADILTKGTTEQRPTLAENDEGFQYYDTTLHKPIWWNGTQWIDGTNTSME